LCRHITSLYLHKVESYYSPRDIAVAFYRCGIFITKNVSFEPNGLYNRVYIDINHWLDTESAYNFICRLKNPYDETRFIHNEAEKLWCQSRCIPNDDDDLWWVVKINKYPHKLIQNTEQNRNITAIDPSIFDLYSHYFDDFTCCESERYEDQYEDQSEDQYEDQSDRYSDRYSDSNHQDQSDSNHQDQSDRYSDSNHQDQDFIQQKYNWADQLLEYKYIQQQYTFSHEQHHRPLLY